MVHLRYRLEVAGLRIDVRAADDLDLSGFDERARRYAATNDAGAAEDVLELQAFASEDEAPKHASVVCARTPDGSISVEVPGAEMTLSPSPGRSRARMLAGQRFAFENVLRVIVSRRMLQTGGAVLHAAGLAGDDFAAAFPGASGAGKSTLTLRHPAAGRVSEDLLAVRPDARGRWTMEALPFVAFHQLDLGPRREPFGAFAFPEHANAMHIRPLSRAETVTRLARCLVSFVPLGLEQVSLDRLIALSRDVPGFALELDLSTPFWATLRAAASARAVGTTWAA